MISVSWIRYKSMPQELDSKIKKLKPLVFILLITPFVSLVWQFYKDELGANPIEAITHGTGEWALRILLLTLAVSPLRRIFGYNALVQFRRMLGLTCFFYVVMHFSIYIVLDQWFALDAIFEDIKERPYITVGFLAFVLMTPLAITSTNAMQRKLQSAWVKLHKLIYVISVLAILHFWWLVKADLMEPIIYAFILAFLLGYRLRTFMKSNWQPR